MGQRIQRSDADPEARLDDLTFPRDGPAPGNGPGGNYSPYHPDLDGMAKVGAENEAAVPGELAAAAGRNDAAEALWTAREVATYLRTSVSWVYQKAESGLIPSLPRMPGSSFLRFDVGAIKAYARGEWRRDANAPLRSSHARRR
jgi:hypothetical protein